MKEERASEWLLRRISFYGMRKGVNLLSESERRRNLSFCKRIASEYAHLMKTDEGRRIMRDAIQFGMSFVWPFSSGQVWDAKDFFENMSKAISESQAARQAGQIPMTVGELEAWKKRREDA